MKKFGIKTQTAFQSYSIALACCIALAVSSNASAYCPQSSSQSAVPNKNVATEIPSRSVNTDDDDDPLTSLMNHLDQNGNKRSAEELKKIRHRQPGFYEKQNQRNLKILSPATVPVRRSTFEVVSEGYWVSMGMVVTADGYAVTKASELGKAKSVKCRFSDRTVIATVEKKDISNDVALLKLEKGTYAPVDLKPTDTMVGTVLLTPGIRKDVLAMGVCSVAPRSLRSQAFLGVDPTEHQGGILVSEVQDAAKRAGLEKGDIITKIDGLKVSKLDQFVNIIRRAGAGGTLEIKALRGNQLHTFSVTLGFRKNANRLARRYKAMDLLGTIKSSRAGRFPWVFQHDTALMPEFCGGPIVDIDGNVVGMNISRGGRIRSYGIGNPWLRDLLKSWSVDLKS